MDLKHLIEPIKVSTLLPPMGMPMEIIAIITIIIKTISAITDNNDVHERLLKSFNKHKGKTMTVAVITSTEYLSAIMVFGDNI